MIPARDLAEKMIFGPAQINVPFSYARILDVAHLDADRSRDGDHVSGMRQFPAFGVAPECVNRAAVLVRRQEPSAGRVELEVPRRVASGRLVRDVSQASGIGIPLVDRQRVVSAV